MKGSVPSKSTIAAKQIVDQILVAGQISRHQYMLLTSAILSDHQLTEEDRRQINHIFDYIEVGRLKLVD
ncbi:hypothetical protein [Argonema galeatum]|uniref:hypothetical protein n=1 Tax=Argonema galeatum TaxID=2942762 RepID=UPI002012C3E3|nr:hypothetical protein [Argonema galeatum]MCL1466738.1 hypothetical protein [Argonema galeatum A003/A1]